MKVYRASALTAFGLVIVLAALVTSALPVAAQEDPLVDQLAAIVLQIESELSLAGAPAQSIERCSKALVNSQATGLDREIFISNLTDELSAFVEDDAALQNGLEAVDALVAQYQALAGEA